MEAFELKMSVNVFLSEKVVLGLASVVVDIAHMLGGWLELALFNSSPPGRNGRHLGRRQFQLHFLEWKW